MTSSSASRVRTPPAALISNVRRRVRAHQPQVVERGAGGREAGARLDEVGPGRLAQVARADLLASVRYAFSKMTLTIAPAACPTSTIARMSASTSASRPDLRAPIWMHHVELGRAVGQRSPRLRHLDLGGVVAVRKADRRADGDVGAGQDRLRPAHVGGPAAHRGDVVLGREPATGLDERVVQLGPEQRVVDRLGDVAFGQGSRWKGSSSLTSRTAAGRRGRSGSRASPARRSSRTCRSSCSMMQSPA